MKKAILFDFDGVLTVDKTGSQSILNYLSAKTGIPFDTLKAAYKVLNTKHPPAFDENNVFFLYKKELTFTKAV